MTDFQLTSPDDPVQSEELTARIVTDLALDQFLSYTIPDTLVPEIRVGRRVCVYVRNDLRKGYVMAMEPRSSLNYTGKLRPIHSICVEEPEIPENLIRLGQWMANYYCCAQESAIRTLLPGAVRSGKNKARKEIFYLPGDPEKTTLFFEKEAKRKKAQATVLQYVIDYKSGVSRKHLIEQFPTATTHLKKLVESGVIMTEERLVEVTEMSLPSLIPSVPLELNEEQFLALEKLKKMMDIRFVNPTDSSPHTLLLHGVTGSGKTEVYLQAIDYAIQQGKEAIVLVPEIALTPQTVLRFESRFGRQVSVLHSALSDKERYKEWNKINDGKVKIAIGARSVLFAPFQHLGLIIVDEEHEGTYKQAEAPRYHARDVAVVRGLKEGAVVILGSATPSMESYYNATQGRYALATLSKRILDYPLPEIQIVDMRLVNADNGPSLFSQKLVDAMWERLNNREQTILFLNRRGYARYLHCDNCGYDATCSSCSVTYTYHKSREMLMCHFCGETMPAPLVCPSCHDKNIRYSGSGTEKIELSLAKLFPHARIVRMDSDTMTKAEDYDKTLTLFQAGEIDILLGTQMIAKGLDFPRVTLVGILNADLSLMMPDFRAEERTFQLLTQVAGRAGRGELHGDVFIQTRIPHNPAIRHAVNHDFLGFYEDEEPLRRDLEYPPFVRMIAIYFRGTEEASVRECADLFYAQISNYLDPGASITEPMPAPIERIQGKFRYLLVVKGEVLNRVRQAIRHEVCHGHYPSSVDIFADVDPVAIL